MHGFTLIEFIIFITVISLIITGAFVTQIYLLRHHATTGTLLQAASLAQSRLELILAQREKGYKSFTDPCNSAPLPDSCILLLNFAAHHGLAVTSNIDTSTWHKIITITVDTSSKQQYLLQTQVSDYERL